MLHFFYYYGIRAIVFSLEPRRTSSWVGYSLLHSRVKTRSLPRTTRIHFRPRTLRLPLPDSFGVSCLGRNIGYQCGDLSSHRTLSAVSISFEQVDADTIGPSTGDFCRLSNPRLVRNLQDCRSSSRKFARTNSHFCLGYSHLPSEVTEAT